MVPPTPLVQFYVECVDTLMQSIVTAFGSAAGTAAPITSAFVMLVVLCVGKIYEWRQRRLITSQVASSTVDNDNGTRTGRIRFTSWLPVLHRKQNEDSQGPLKIQPLGDQEKMKVLLEII